MTTDERAVTRPRRDSGTPSRSAAAATRPLVAPSGPIDFQVGPYRLLLRLAAGGGANVFLARDTSAPAPGRLVALKVILPHLVSVPEAVRSFFTEARIAARLDHPNIVAIAGFGERDGVYGLAMEYVFGGSLADVLNTSNRVGRPLTVCGVLWLVAQICDALHYAHETLDEQGRRLELVHRDVSPENILVGFDGVPKLTDFGIAKIMNRGWETQAGILKGKSRYMSPEQLLSRRVDRRSDVFVAGVVLWESLTGRPLFTGANVTEIFRAIGQRPIPTPSEASPGLPPVVDATVMRALRRPPSERYATAKEFADELRALLDGAGVDVTSAALAGELASIYGAAVRRRAELLRRALHGESLDVEALADALGGEPLDASQLPRERMRTGGIDVRAFLRAGEPRTPTDPTPAQPAHPQRELMTMPIPRARKVRAESSVASSDDLAEVLGLAPESVTQPEQEPHTDPTGWQPGSTTIDERTAPFLLLSEQELRGPDVPEAIRAYLIEAPSVRAAAAEETLMDSDAALSLDPASLTLDDVTVQGEAVSRNLSAVRAYVDEPETDDRTAPTPIGARPSERVEPRAPSVLRAEADFDPSRTIEEPKVEHLSADTAFEAPPIPRPLAVAGEAPTLSDSRRLPLHPTGEASSDPQYERLGRRAVADTLQIDAQPAPSGLRGEIRVKVSVLLSALVAMFLLGFLFALLLVRLG